MIRRALNSDGVVNAIPVLLVGTKVCNKKKKKKSHSCFLAQIDLRTDQANELSQEVLPIMNQFPEVETCVEVERKGYEEEEKGGGEKEEKKRKTRCAFVCEWVRCRHQSRKRNIKH